jgi:hypothetical protein
VPCGELEQVGLDGRIPSQQCSFLAPLTAHVCECQASTTGEINTPEGVPSTVGARLCPDSAPEGGCYVCGSNLCVGDPDAIFAFPGQPRVPCGVLEEAGFDGLIPLDQCQLLSTLVDICKCGETLQPPSPPPTPFPVLVPTEEPSRKPTPDPSPPPSPAPTLMAPSHAPSRAPSLRPTVGLTSSPTPFPSVPSTLSPSRAPSPIPTRAPVPPPPTPFPFIPLEPDEPTQTRGGAGSSQTGQKAVMMNHPASGGLLPMTMASQGAERRGGSTRL